MPCLGPYGFGKTLHGNVTFAVFRCVVQLQIESSRCQSRLDDVEDAGITLFLQIVSTDDAEFDNLLCNAVANGNYQLLCIVGVIRVVIILQHSVLIEDGQAELT